MLQGRNLDWKTVYGETACYMKKLALVCSICLFNWSNQKKLKKLIKHYTSSKKIDLKKIPKFKRPTTISRPKYLSIYFKVSTKSPFKNAVHDIKKMSSRFFLILIWLIIYLIKVNKNALLLQISIMLTSLYLVVLGAATLLASVSCLQGHQQNQAVQCNLVLESVTRWPLSAVCRDPNGTMRYSVF